MGGLVEEDADHLLDVPDRHAGAGGRMAAQRILQQGRNPAAGAHTKQLRPVRAWTVCGRSYAALHVPFGFCGLLRRGESPAAGHAHESPQGMLWPLRILAAFSIIGGVIGIEQVYALPIRAG